jgi:hypothetical protein
MTIRSDRRGTASSRPFFVIAARSRTAAALYSLTGTCKHLGIDPFAYLRDVLGRLPAHPLDRLGELLPDVWFEAHPQARRKKVA